MKVSHSAEHEKAKLKREVKQGRPGAQDELDQLTGARHGPPRHDTQHWQSKMSRSTHKERKHFQEEQKKQEEEFRRQQEERDTAQASHRREEEEAQEQGRQRKAAKEDAKGGKKAAKEVEMEDPGMSEFQAKAAERDRKMKEAAIAAKQEVERLRRKEEEHKALEERRRLALKKRAVMLPRLEAKVSRDMVRLPLEGWAAYKRDKRHGDAVMSAFARTHARRLWFSTLRNLARDRKHRDGVERAFARSVDLSLLLEHVAAWSTLTKLTRPAHPKGAWNPPRPPHQGSLLAESSEFQPSWPLAHPGQAAALIAERSMQHAHGLAPPPPHAGAAPHPDPHAFAAAPPQQYHAGGFQQALSQAPPPSAEELRHSALEVAAGKLAEGRGLARQGCTLDALACFEESLRLRVEAVGEDHPLTVEAMYESGLVCPDRQRAVELLQRCVAVEERARGEHHPETGQCMLGAGMALLASGSEAEALVMLARAAGAFEASAGTEDARFRRAVDAMLDIM